MSFTKPQLSHPSSQEHFVRPKNYIWDFLSINEPHVALQTTNESYELILVTTELQSTLLLAPNSLSEPLVRPPSYWALKLHLKYFEPELAPKSAKITVFSLIRLFQNSNILKSTFEP